MDLALSLLTEHMPFYHAEITQADRSQMHAHIYTHTPIYLWFQITSSAAWLHGGLARGSKLDAADRQGNDRSGEYVEATREESYHWQQPQPAKNLSLLAPAVWMDGMEGS